MRVRRGPSLQIAFDLIEFVGGINADYLNKAVGISFCYFDQMRELRIARTSICMPEVKYHDLSGKIGKRYLIAVGIGQGKIRSFLALGKTLRENRSKAQQQKEDQQSGDKSFFHYENSQN